MRQQVREEVPLQEVIKMDIEEWTGFDGRTLAIMVGTVGFKERLTNIAAGIVPEDIKSQVADTLRIGGDEALQLMIGLAARKFSKSKDVRVAGSALILNALFDAGEALLAGVQMGATTGTATSNTNLGA